MDDDAPMEVGNYFCNALVDKSLYFYVHMFARPIYVLV